jgi:hypothetical protein
MTRAFPGRHIEEIKMDFDKHLQWLDCEDPLEVLSYAESLKIMDEAILR